MSCNDLQATLKKAVMTGGQIRLSKNDRNRSEKEETNDFSIKNESANKAQP